MLFQSYTKKEPKSKQFQYKFGYEEKDYEFVDEEDTIVIDLNFPEITE